MMFAKWEEWMFDVFIRMMFVDTEFSIHLLLLFLFQICVAVAVVVIVFHVLLSSLSFNANAIEKNKSDRWC